MSSTKISDQLGGFLVGDGFVEGRHFLTAMENLAGDLLWDPELVFAQVDERWAFLCADAAYTVALWTTSVAIQDRAGHFGGLGLGSKKAVGGERSEKHDALQQGEAFRSGIH